MDSRATGLILRIRPLTETSLIVHWLTPDFGRIATVAKGALRPKSPFRGKLDLFFLGEFTFVRSRRSDLHNLREVSIRETHATLRRELSWLEQAAYATELVEQTTETETPLPECFALMVGFLTHLLNHPPQAQNIIAFELKLLHQLGLSPSLTSTRLTAGSKQIVKHLGELDWPALPRIKPNPEQIREIQTFLQEFLVHHFGSHPGGRRRHLRSRPS